MWNCVSERQRTWIAAKQLPSMCMHKLTASISEILEVPGGAVRINTRIPKLYSESKAISILSSFGIEHYLAREWREGIFCEALHVLPRQFDILGVDFVVNQRDSCWISCMIVICDVNHLAKQMPNWYLITYVVKYAQNIKVISFMSSEFYLKNHCIIYLK